MTTGGDEFDLSDVVPENANRTDDLIEALEGALFVAAISSKCSVISREITREAFYALLNEVLPPSEIELLRAKLAKHGKLSPVMQGLFDWVMDLHTNPPKEVTRELVEGLTFLAKRVNRELERCR